MPSEFELTSADGTLIRGWRSGQAGPPVVIANGLGAIPEAWPALLAEGSGYDALTWYHRGTFGSARPADRGRITVHDHAADLLALMDDQGVDKALVVGWSVGVNMAFDFAQRHPERVAGLLGVAGVPGGTFAAMGGPLGIPRRLRHPLALGVTKTGRAVGPALNRLAPRLPVTRRTAWLLAHSGFLRPAARPEVLVPMLQRFLTHDWTWYGELAVAAAEHEPMDLSFVTCPVSLLAGRHDLITTTADVAACAERIPTATLTVLPGSHFLPVELPDQVHQALDELAQRAGVPA